MAIVALHCGGGLLDASRRGDALCIGGWRRYAPNPQRVALNVATASKQRFELRQNIQQSNVEQCGGVLHLSVDRFGRECLRPSLSRLGHPDRLRSSMLSAKPTHQLE